VKAIAQGSNNDAALLNTLLSKEGMGALDEITVLYNNFGLSVTVETLDTMCGLVFLDYARAAREMGNTRATICGHVFPSWQYGNMLPVGQIAKCKPELNDPRLVLTSILDACVKPCMNDKKQQCCFVPSSVSWMFSCCQEKGCCADPARSRHSRRALQAAGGVVASDVSSTQHAQHLFSKLLTCLRTKDIATCTTRAMQKRQR